MWTRGQKDDSHHRQHGEQWHIARKYRYIVQSGLTFECVFLFFFGVFYLMILKHGSPGANETIESEIESKEELSEVC